MSSQLALLNKTRSTTLHGTLNEDRDKGKVLMRKSLHQDSPAAMSDHYTSVKPNSRVPSHTCIDETSTSNYKDSSKTGDPLCHSELMHVLVQRLTSLEETVRSQAEEMENKGKKISLLEQKLQTQHESGRVDGSGDDLETRCQKLQLQVNEMEDFLGDYGLTWVGKGKSSGRRFHIDFNLVLQNIHELNAIAAEEELFVQTTARGGTLSRKDPVQLKLFRNGMVMSDEPFRSYQEHSTQQFMQDIVDGYFPSELQDTFPDGVPFQVHDMRHVDFVDGPAWDAFPGKGYSVCGDEEEEPPKMIRYQPGTDQLLNKLSKGSSDSPKNSTVIHLDTPALQAVTQSSGASKDITVLKVKSEDGNHMYLVTMFLSETVGHLRSYLDKHRAGGLPGYHIISAYPPRRRFSDDGLTLLSCGLTANTTLLLLGRRKLPARIKKTHEV
ncbi:UBX domain-containing protein 11 isoform X1 [Oryzias melastigma]|uniref:UBX domain-containing protein 11 n=1 Tax=Oryzias melastigma TaxID=30732 RepID=A0A3B3BYD7_ORYME|nr:UBX domain-containing protein 11 isoform X1 [Oryzias melastigma]